jgi:lysozyme family protein
MAVYKTIRKFLHRNDGFLYTTQGVSIPIKATTSANLTGPITSVGNATSVASQTGTGSTFVMSASPTITGTLAVTGDITITENANWILRQQVFS